MLLDLSLDNTPPTVWTHEIVTTTQDFDPDDCVYRQDHQRRECVYGHSQQYYPRIYVAPFRNLVKQQQAGNEYKCITQYEKCHITNVILDAFMLGHLGIHLSATFHPPVDALPCKRAMVRYSPDFNVSRLAA